jgi:hypothetical protein
MISFKLLNETNKSDIIPFLLLLDKQISEDILGNRLAKMFSQGYKCVGIFEEKKWSAFLEYG